MPCNVNAGRETLQARQPGHDHHGKCLCISSCCTPHAAGGVTQVTCRRKRAAQAWRYKKAITPAADSGGQHMPVVATFSASTISNDFLGDQRKEKIILSSGYYFENGNSKALRQKVTRHGSSMVPFKYFMPLE